MNSNVIAWLCAGSILLGGCGSSPQVEAASTQAQAESPATAVRVTLSDAAHANAHIEVEPVRNAAAGSAEPLEVPGAVEADPRRVALVSARVPGRVERLLVVAGERVDSGEAVVTLHSPAFLTSQSDYVQAHRRSLRLAGTPDSAGARAIATAAARRLRLAGAGDDQIRALGSDAEPEPFLTVLAPIAGSIMEGFVLPGAAIEAGAALFRIADLSVVDVVADVPERALPLVSVGQHATVTLAAYPGMVFRGRVERLHEELDPETRTLHAVIHVPNPNGALRPGMFAAVALDVPAGKVAGASAAFTIPESALLTDGVERHVFVEVGLRTYERRVVEVASLAPLGAAGPASGRVAILAGVRAGDRVVVKGAFVLKSELAKASLTEDDND